MKKLPTGMTIIVPAIGMVNDIMDKIEVFAEQPDREIFVKALAHKPVTGGRICGINRNSIGDLIVAMYLDMLADASMWARLTASADHTTTQWNKMVDGFDEKVPRTLQNLLFRDVTQEAYEDVHDWLNEFDTEHQSWNVWYVRRIGLDIMLEKGEDYRVLDWERRMQQGADNQKAKAEGETLPESAWLPDPDSQRYVDLLKVQQSRPSMLGKSHAEEQDSERRRAQKRKPISRRRYGQGTSPL